MECKSDTVNFPIFQMSENLDIVLLHASIVAYVILQQQLFAFCYLGQIITSKLPEVGAAMFGSKWYRFANKHHCHIEMIILRSQKMYILKGHGLLPCTLENFKEVTHHLSPLFVNFIQLAIGYGFIFIPRFST